MAEFYGNIEKMTTENDKFRKVLGTTNGMQLVVMRLGVGEEIGREVHPTTTQFFRVESGSALVTIDDREYELGEDEAIIVPPNKYHNVKNSSKTEDLHLYTIYSEPLHERACVQKTKQEKEC